MELLEVDGGTCPSAPYSWRRHSDDLLLFLLAAKCKADQRVVLFQEQTQEPSLSSDDIRMLTD